MKKAFKFVSIIMILLGVIANSKSYVFATHVDEVNKSSMYLGVTELMTEDTPNMGYAIGEPGNGGAKLWNIVKYSSSTSNDPTEINAYCVKAGVGFSDTNKRETYDTFYDMKKEREIIKTKAGLEDLVIGTTADGKEINRYDALLAAIDMLYIPEGTTESQEKDLQKKNAVLKNIVEIAKNSDNNSWLDDLGEDGLPNHPLTDNDIMAVQQAALWYFTNYGEDSSIYDQTGENTTSWLKYTLNGTDYTALTGYNQATSEGIIRNDQAEILYKYIIEQAKENASNYSDSATTEIGAPAQVNTTKLNYIAQEDNYIIGPINISETEGNSNDYTIDFLVKNNADEINNYTLLDSEKKAVASGTTVKDLIGQNFYISIPKTYATAVSVKITINYEKTNMVLWTAEQTDSIQPIFIPEKESVSIPVELTVSPKTFDLSLRKYIVAVSTDETIDDSDYLKNTDGSYQRKPVVDTTNLVAGITATEEQETAVYKHRKDPVTVATGNKVIYNLEVYNEGENSGRATKIVDQLPAGLKFTKVVSGNFEPDTSKAQNGYDETTNTVYLTRKSGNISNLSAYVTGNLDSEIIQIECEVTMEAGTTGKVLTNVAWISEEVDGETGETITTEKGKDRDSEPGTTPKEITSTTQNELVTEDNGYIGNESNSGKDLTNKDEYFKGQQDDDDFEKIIIPGVVQEKIFDLSLRKSITKLNNVDTSTNRLPQVDSSNLNKNENTTANYNHDKTPLQSDTNQEIEYTITVYNEGELSGYAGEIKDYLPAGIEYIGLVDESDSSKYEVTAQKDDATGKTILTITNKEKKILQPYDETTNTVEKVEFKIKCKVTAERTETEQVLTNIAEITDYRDENGTDMTEKDRDSRPENFPEEKKTNNYNGNGENGNYIPGQQDDDDFEKIVIPKANGNYNLQIVKIDTENINKKLSGAKFKVTLADGTEKTVVTNADGVVEIEGINIEQEGTETITIEEVTAPTGYNKLLNSLQLEATKTIENGEYKVSNIKLKNVQSTGLGEGQVNAKVENGVVIVTIPNKEIEKTFDLSLRKYITKLNGENLVNTRIPEVDTTNLVAGTDATEEQKTASYKHRKDPVVVTKGTTVTYNLTIYNEGEKEGRATKIVDQLPKGLKFSRVVSDNFEPDTSKVQNGYDETTNTLYLIRKTGNEVNLPAYTEGNLESETVEIECEVTAVPDIKNAKVLTNIAWISEEYNAEDNITITNQEGSDRDSEPETKPKEITTTTQDELVTEDNGYIGSESNAGKDLSNKDEYFEGEQDDDDFEKIVLMPESFDLKLIKRITEVNNQAVPERIKGVDVSELNTIDANGNMITTAEYDLDKEPVAVKKGDIVTYTFRIYNEGTIDGYAEEITEDIPEGLEFIWSEKEGEELKADTTLTDEEKEAIEFNQKYLWGKFVYDENKENIVQISSSYLSKENETTVGGNVITAFGKNDGTKTEEDLSYKELSVKLKVIANNISGTTIRNEACISEDCDKNGDPVDDRDSNTEEWKKYEDDEDFDNIILQSFDLSLRKFIIAVSHDESIEDEEYLKNKDGSYKRAPVVDTSKLNTEDEEGNLITTATYNHTKEPILVAQEDTIVYMLRVYNEGDIDGYAAEIKDHLPEQLEFVKGEFNEKYGWELSEDGRTVTTRYLENEKITKATTGEDGKIVLSYKEVPIMCKIKENAKTSENITNIADITEYQDENKKPVTDRDSQEDNVELPDDKDLPGYKDDETGEYIPGQQDDDDFEKVIVKTFDLALRKWVTQAIVIDSNGQTVTQTGHQPYDDPEQIVKVELHRKKLNEVTVKFRYSIRVINEGELEGYAKEVTDYIPEGLKFVAEDNPGWTDEGNNVISTRLLENTLLKPGEYADVEVVFTWINNENNMGVMVNTAEISEDYNEYGVPDKDSIPDNQKPGEDDIDDAPVMLSIATGQMRIYFMLGFIALITTASGVLLIKRFVL